MNHHFYDVNRRKLIALKDGMIIGRAEGELRFAGDQLMSGRHCKIHIFDKELLLEDLKSSNKTFINGHVVEPSVRIQLKAGDVIDVGNQRFVYNDRGEVPEAHRPKAEAPAASTPYEPSAFVDYLVSLLQFWNWDPSTKATWLFISITSCFMVWGYYPDFDNSALHGPRALLITSLVISFITAAVFFVFQHLFALKLIRTPGNKALLMMFAVVANAVASFALHAALGVPQKLDQNKIYADCREITSAESYEWCKTWIQQNKNNAFFELNAQTQAEALSGLKVWTEKVKAEKQNPQPEATATAVPEVDAQEQADADAAVVAVPEVEPTATSTPTPEQTVSPDVQAE